MSHDPRAVPLGSDALDIADALDIGDIGDIAVVVEA